MSKHVRGVKPKLSPDHEPLKKVPPAPKRFNKYARAEWNRVLPQLVARQIITRADLSGIENYCIAVGVVDQITELQAGAAIPDLKLGGLQIRYMTVAKQLASEYGLTPTSRARIGSAGADDDDDDNPLTIGRNRARA